MINRMKICKIDMNYLAYLSQFDDKVVKADKHNRKFVGVVLEVSGVKYYAPMSSPKEKHLKLKNNSPDIVKLQDGRLGVINLNNMFPVPDKAVIAFDIRDEQDVRYKELLKKQAFFISSLTLVIKKKANKLHTLVKANNPIASRCCNFRLLESKLEQWQAQQEAAATTENNT